MKPRKARLDQTVFGCQRTLEKYTRRLEHTRNLIAVLRRKGPLEHPDWGWHPLEIAERRYVARIEGIQFALAGAQRALKRERAKPKRVLVPKFELLYESSINLEDLKRNRMAATVTTRTQGKDGKWVVKHDTIAGGLSRLADVMDVVGVEGADDIRATVKGGLANITKQ